MARALASSRRAAHLRRAPLDPGGIMATTLAQARLHAMDVGAAGGVADHWRDVLPLLEIDCFEPNEAECRRLQHLSPPNVHWFPVALAGASGSRRFHVLNRATGSSLYPPNKPVILEYSGESYAGVRRVIDVQCSSLADFLEEHDRPVPALVKLDTQGTELEILSSLASSQLEQVLCIEVEVEFVEMYVGQPTFGDVHAFMQEHGFRLLDLRTHRSYRNAHDRPRHFLRQHLNTAVGSAALSAELVAGDALYLREPDVGASSMTPALLIAYLCVLRIYRFYDLSFWLVEQAVTHRVITAAQRDALLRDVAHGAPKPRIHERDGVVGDVSRRVRSVLALDDHEVFWTQRTWPDQ
jgi:FkbM family methyltransferase